MERESLKIRRHKSGQAPFRAYSSARRRALCCDWLDTASCPGKTMQVEDCRAASHFIGEIKRSRRRCNFSLSSAVCSLSHRIVKFKLSIAAIREARDLLRSSLQIVVQDDGLRDFLHGLARLLALPLHGPVGFFLANFHFALQDPLGALHQLPGFQLAGENGLFALQLLSLSLVLL